MMKHMATSLAVLAAASLAACATSAAQTGGHGADATSAATSSTPVSEATFQKDRSAILAMAGDYKVKFDFIETVPFAENYELKPEKISGGYEVVRVIEDRGDFISLQHILVVGGDEKLAIKHWRQDWQYEPQRVLVFIGGNAWEWQDVPDAERAGTWSQTVYQVDDAPRYGAVGSWDYDDGIAEWTPPREWRPLPRRDMTTRDDYNAVDAINRHAITPWGWVHEQDNSKLVLAGEPHVLVREVGVNTYRHNSDFDASIATDYWASTEDFWAAVRDEWNRIEDKNQHFAITIKGETEDLYIPLLELAESVGDGEKPLDEATAEARALIRTFVTSDIGTLDSRLRPTSGSPVKAAN
ncbi:hypothetical protein HY29_09645 [Hyphomonas beringensis]|uniref:Uncharacterized protein n=1 Tax=Hyphomonas beringensis TaxID=1280946 RepID=A0A062UIA6_9PROT|nr:DUF6607 family protein [Hyphomonas beringensis]KCZ56304.1 hypothetical protein HY29_09645 [Hyphomonas beringensis]